MDDTEHDRKECCATNSAESANAIPRANDAASGDWPSEVIQPNTAPQPSIHTDLLAQARELLKDPAFMEEVMELVKLQIALEKEINSHTCTRLLSVLARDIWRT